MENIMLKEVQSVVTVCQSWRSKQKPGADVWAIVYYFSVTHVSCDNLAASSSLKNGGLWQNTMNLTLSVLQLPGSRLKTVFSSWDFDLEMEILKLENQLEQQNLMDEISSLSSPSCWSKKYSKLNNLKPINLGDTFGSLDLSLLSPLKGHHIRQNQLRASYPTNLSSSPVRNPSSFGFVGKRRVAHSIFFSLDGNLL
ncbi:zinc finger CCCH domain-containing protein 29-like [Hibiscus syriacus]|uniref:zinc finger CCCH domain-containing protein 29-like n=1 Tax=Hibiscus syriacus TaxID=106335 RepID=UPI001923A878|nr:zinc finger CCCH domain-containing protein 29-like [Hibiscus syriacus]